MTTKTGQRKYETIQCLTFINKSTEIASASFYEGSPVFPPDIKSLVNGQYNA